MRDLVEQVAARCRAGGLTLAVAEASTGGLVTDALTDLAGASGYLLGGVVPYDNRSKIELLGVPAELLAAHGAASAEVAAALATGVRRVFGSDLGLAVSGLLGPKTGRSPKPVGLTFVAVASSDGVRVAHYYFRGGRRGNKVASARAGLDLLLEVLADQVVAGGLKR